MPDDRTAATLLREVGLLADGPAPWGKPVRHAGPGVFVVELPAPLPSPGLDLALVGKWLERVPDLRLDGDRPHSKELLARLGTFWLPSQPVLFVGSTGGSVAGRVAGIVKTLPGDRKPASSAFWLQFLRSRGDLHVWWAATEAPEEYEDALLEAFAGGVPEAERAALPDPAIVLPWAVQRAPSGARKPTGITNPLLPEVKARQEPLALSPEGLARLEAEVESLRAQRPEVIKRIATAREHGDLKENAEYHAAREEQGFLEGRITALEGKLKNVVVVAPTERGAIVELGSRVRVQESGEESVLQVVSSAEANSREGRISSVSPVGAALLGRKVGDAVTIITPGGEIRYEILEIS
jgi:transcription elongation factor GreA